MQRPCLIAAVDLNERAEAIIRRAGKLAAFCGAELIVVHVVEYDTGFESDHVPFMTPAQLRAAMARDARAWLVGLLHHLGIANAQVIVRAGKVAEVLAQMVNERRTHYIVTGQLKWGSLSKLASLSKDPRVVEARCDVLSVGVSEGGWSGTVSRLMSGLIFGSQRGPRAKDH